MSKRVCFFLIILLDINLAASKIVNTSIPKCGTFMLMNLTHFITGLVFGYDNCSEFVSQMYRPTIEKLAKCTLSNDFNCYHLPYNPEYSEFFKQNNIKVCFIYRDPRDQVVSQVYYMFLQADREKRGYGRFNFNSLLTALIGDNEKSPFQLEHFQDMSLEMLSSMEYISHIKRYYELFLGWQKSDICYSVRFEDLVGPRGGGTVERQKNEITNIAKHLGVELSESQINHISANLFGNTDTFREGKIGSWKGHFTEDHKKQFKAVADDLLIKLGYEQDNNW